MIKIHFYHMTFFFQFLNSWKKISNFKPTALILMFSWGHYLQNRLSEVNEIFQFARKMIKL